MPVFRLKRQTQPEHGHRDLEADSLALNLSFVLHERSTSHAVQSAVRTSRAHATGLTRIDDGLATPATVSEHNASGVTLWLTATIGLPHLLERALAVRPEQIIAVDSDSPTLLSHRLFRADAELRLPDDSERRLGVVALVLRPGRRTSHLEVTGIYDWPREREATIRSLERLIQMHAGQWMPPRPLWPAPAESLLSEEVY